MSKTFATAIFQLGLATWASTTTDPGAGAGTPGAIGSWWQRSSAPVGVYRKTAAVDTGWTYQNLINVNVYNIKDFGAIGDGVTNDTAAIQAAVNAANAAGGGCVYFPPTTQFYSIVKIAGKLDIIDLVGVTNVTLLGDGIASKIKQTGTVAFGESHMVGVRNGAARIRIVNLYFDAVAITSPDPARQNHIIEVYSTTSSGIAPTDVEILGCYFGYSAGDAVRFLGTAGKILTNVKCKLNVMNLLIPGAQSRSGYSIQRNSQTVQIHHNWSSGARGGEIDFEPTSAVPPEIDAPAYYSIIGNIFDHQDQLTDPLTLSRSWFNVCSYNILNRSVSISAVNVWNTDIRGNIIDWTGDNTQYGIDLQSTCNNVRVLFNLINIPTQTNNRRGISIQSGSGGVFPSRCIVFGNFVKCPIVTGQGGIFNAAVNGVTVGNICDMYPSAPGNGFGITIGGPAVCHGNLVIANVTSVDKIVAAITGGGPGVSVNSNVGIGVFTRAIQFGSPGPYPISIAAGNTCWGATALFINNESGNLFTPIGTDGNAGPGSLVAEIALAAGPAGLLAAGIGSLCTSTLANRNQTLFYKESGVPTSNAGWVGYGETDVTMGAALGDITTADRFLAPGGLALATESTVEIQWAVPHACTIRNLRIRCIAGVGAGNNTFVVRKNGVNTALTVVVVNSTTGGNDTTNSFTAAAGDLISIRVSKSIAPATPQTNILATFGVI